MTSTLLNKIKLIEDFEFEGDYIAFKELLDQSNKKFHLEWFTRKELKIYSKWSIGTFGGGANRINGWVHIKNTHATPLQLQFRTNIRWELIFFAAFGLLVSVLVIFGEHQAPAWAVVLLPVTLLWVWGVLRWQEQVLLKQFKKLLQ